MTTAARARHSPTRRILLLSGQAFALGLTTAWIIIPASTIFLEAYGSELLPVTYIGAGVAGVASSTVLASAFRRRPLASVATTTLAGLSIALLASWLALSASGASWVSFALLVLVPIVVPVGFIFVVGQAGMLLDVRTLKALYARVVAGFALGFVAGGLAGPSLLTLLGHTESLLAAAAIGSAAFLGLVVATQRRYPTELSVIADAEVAADAGRPTVRALSRDRYVMLIVAFQMLSAVESQWLDFLVLARAADRYGDSNELARFIGRFSAIAYGSDIVFLLVLAGWLLRRLGLRYGLTANSLAVLTLVAAVVLASSISGSSSTIVFVLIVAARVADLTFSDGTSRTSLSAVYQAVPTRMRAVAQATVEGLAVPVAIGVSGVVLLVVQSLGGTDGVTLPILTAMVVLAWAVVAILLYRDYRVNLLANLRGRTLRPADLTVDDGSSLVVIDRLVESNDERDIRLGLDILTIAQHPELSTRLQRLVLDERAAVRTDALERLVQLAPDMAVAAARQGVDDLSADVRGASIRVLGAAGHSSDLARIASRANDSALDVRVAVAYAMTRIGDAAVRDQVAVEIHRLARSESADDRIVAGLMVGEIDPITRADHALLRMLLTDPDPDVVNAALAALGERHGAELLPAVVVLLESRRTAAAAEEALVRIGDAALVVVDDRLRNGEHGRRAQELLVRASREIGGPGAAATLRRHVGHRDREVGLAVMRALAALGPSVRDLTETDATEAVVRADLEHATHVLRALVTIEEEARTSVLRAALRDELDLLRRRVLAAFATRHGIDGFNRVVYQLTQQDARSHALALEWLDVTLTGPARAAIAILEPGWSDGERLNLLLRSFPLAPESRRAILLDLVHDPDGRWRRPWLTACALYTASVLPQMQIDLVDDHAIDDTAGFQSNDGESIVHETLTGIRQRRLDPP